MLCPVFHLDPSRTIPLFVVQMERINYLRPPILFYSTIFFFFSIICRLPLLACPAESNTEGHKRKTHNCIDSHIIGHGQPSVVQGSSFHTTELPNSAETTTIEFGTDRTGGHNVAMRRRENRAPCVSVCMCSPTTAFCSPGWHSNNTVLLTYCVTVGACLLGFFFFQRAM